MTRDQSTEPVVFVLFGAGGDLAWRKLAPALFALSRRKELPESFAILGVGRSELTDEKLRRRLKHGVDRFSCRGKPHPGDWRRFSRDITYLRGDVTEVDTSRRLAKRIAAIEKRWKAPAKRIFYLSTPPFLFVRIPPRLAQVGLLKDPTRSRIVVEKPFGHDLGSAQELNRLLHAHFDEKAIFRIDHFLGKDTVQNILAFRFASPFFEPVWNHHYISHVMVTAAEELGVEQRGRYYEQAGALRDMLQNHLLQLLCLVAMEPMVSFESNEMRNKMVDLLHAVRPISQDAVHHHAVRGQYDQGRIHGRRVPSYREEEDVARDSVTETFAAVKLWIDNWRWQKVPFYLRTGKRLRRSVSEVAVHFHPVPHRAFPAEAILAWQPARLTLLIKPDEGIRLHFQARRPGSELRLQPVNMEFNFRDWFHKRTSDAYQTLLLDAIRGDTTLFMRTDQVEAAWRLLMPVLELWSEKPPVGFPNYKAGTWGPSEADALLAREGHSWLLPASPTAH